MIMRAALLLLLAPSLALGQAPGSVAITESSDLQNGGRNDGIINIAECNGTPRLDVVTLSWSLTAPPAAGTWYRLYATTQACPRGGDPTPTNVDLASGFQATNGFQTGSLTRSIEVRGEILVPLSVGCAVTTNVNLCVTVYDSGQATVQDTRATAVLKVDASAPAQPVGVLVSPGDGRLHVAWSAGSGGTATAGSYTATATPVPPNASETCNAGGAPGSTTVTGAGSTSGDIGGLTNSACYEVTVTATSDAGNPGPESAPVRGTPLPVDDFWRYYRGAGGREEGGCGGSAGLPALLALPALAPRLRRRRQ